MKRVKLWFHPKTHSGFRKSKSYRENIRTLKRRYGTTKKGLLHSARAMLALSNVTKDRETKRKARKLAEYFLELYHRKKLGL